MLSVLPPAPSPTRPVLRWSRAVEPTGSPRPQRAWSAPLQTPSPPPAKRSSWTRRLRSDLWVLPSMIKEIDGVETQEEDGKAAENLQRSISECYFTVKGTALVLPQNDCTHVYRKNSTNAGDIQQHLQSMLYLLRPEDTLKMAVKLESMHVGRMRYLVVVSCTGRQSTEESCLLGIDCNDKATIGLVLPVWADTQITLDGDGGFSVSSSGRQHIFKPVSVQAMWSALQTLHKASAKARTHNYYMGGLTHTWIEYYEKRIQSDRSCLNEWHAMDDLESRRPPSPDSLRSRPTEREGTEQYIRLKLKEIMMSVDLDEVTSKYIRSRMEEDMNMDLHEYKSFIDQEMIVILGQMDEATEIFDYLYLGSEWNASNLEELQRNGVQQILNVTREIDNFFPGMFDYLNVRVYDEEGTELLKHWDKTYKFIEKAKKNGSKVLVHCKMGVSRSASVVIAYAMKAYDWNMQRALEFVKNKRNCIKPNTGFLKQLETYQGILDASKQRHNMLWRSKSETNLKSPQQDLGQSSEKFLSPYQPSPRESLYLEVSSAGHRPKSWSPEDNIANLLFPETSNSAMDCPDKSTKGEPEKGRTRSFTDPSADVLIEAKNKHMLLPGRNGQSYSVSPNKVLHLPISNEKKQESKDEKVTFSIGDSDDSPVYECRNPLYIENLCDSEVLTEVTPIARVSSVKDRINELESQLQSLDQKSSRDQLDLPEIRGLVLNLANQFESVSKPNTPSPGEELQTADVPDPLTAAIVKTTTDIEGNEPVVAQMKPPAPRHQAVLVKSETWMLEDKANKRAAEEWQQKEGNTNSGSIELIKQKDNLVMKLRVNNPNASSNGSTPEVENDSVKPSFVSNNLSHPNISSSSSFSQPLSLTDAAERIVAKRNGQKMQSSFAPDGKSSTTSRKDDPFSVHVDRVFDREERYEQATINSHDGRTQIPSRQSSWGSCDSAIVLQAPGRESPSRQSSWGSVDSHNTYLSRESSWGSSDCRSSHSVPCGNVASSLNGIRKASVPDSQYSSPGVEPHSIPFAYDQLATSTIRRAKAKDDVNENGQSTLKRTSSFDGSFAVKTDFEGSTSSNDGSVTSPIQRSHSLRCADRSSRSRYPFPNLKLHTPTPYKSPGDKEGINSGETNEYQLSKILHCASFPSLSHTLENRVSHPCHSASHPNIKSQPLNSTPAIPCESRNSLRLDFGNVVCQPTIIPATHTSSSNVSPFAAQDLSLSPSTSPEDGVCFPGFVQQQKQALARFSTTPVCTEDRSCGKEIIKSQKESPSSANQTSPKIDECNLGKVKRMTKVLESKNGTSSQKADRIVLIDQQGREIDSPKSVHGIERSLSSPAVQSLNGVTYVSPTAEEKSVRSLVGKFEMNDLCRQRYHSENEVELRLGNKDPELSLAQTSPGSYCGGVRKFSLELETPQRKSPPLPTSMHSPHSPVLQGFGKNSLTPLTIKNNRNGSDNRRASESNVASGITACNTGNKKNDTSHSTNVQTPPSKCCTPLSSSFKMVLSSIGKQLPAKKETPSSSTVPLPPPLPLGNSPRKIRKLHGKTQPQNKLVTAKQRHPNPIYNTM